MCESLWGVTRLFSVYKPHGVTGVEIRAFPYAEEEGSYVRGGNRCVKRGLNEKIRTKWVSDPARLSRARSRGEFC